MSSSGVHRGKKVEVTNEDDEAPKKKRLAEKLSNYRETKWLPFIYNLPNHYLRDVKDKVHEPRMVAIGPYHHGKESLNMMEQHKLRYLNSLLLRRDESVGRYLSAVAEIEEVARSCYAEDLSYLSSDEFTEMLVLDGCFIIELLLRSKQLILDPSDIVFQMKWFLDYLKHDLILFENQIPFFVLWKLFYLIHDEEELIESVLHFLGLGPNNGNLKPQEVTHLLHLAHAILRPSSPIFINLIPCPPQREFRLIPSATELKDANVTFRQCQGDTSSLMSFEVEFGNGVLTMSAVPISDETDCFLRNLILYEQYFPDVHPTYVTDYVLVLDNLVNTGRDVEILSQCGIINNMTGNNQEAADIINRLTQFAIVPQDHFIYANTFKQINAHHGRKWNRAKAALNRDYFSTPWAYISFLAALLLLILTLIQTIFSAP